MPNYWADMYGQEYSLYGVHRVTDEFADRLRKFADRAGKIFFKTHELLSSDLVEDDTLLQLGFPPETLSYIRHRSMLPKTVIGRLDAVELDGTPKVMEFNSDTPTFIYECFSVTGKMCAEFGLQNPNDGEEAQLKKAVRSAVLNAYRSLGTSHAPYIVFTSHEDNEEDRNTVLYLKELAGVPSKYVPLKELQIISGEGLFDGEGRKIDVLYRQTFPVESLIKDVDPESGEDVGLQLMELVIEKKLAVVNPPSAFLLQSKAVMAVIWGLHEEKSPFFTDEEHDWIKQCFLPTYLEPDVFIAKGESYVKKPVFGREGDTVEIFDGTGTLVDEDKNKSYKEYLYVYQKYAQLPKTHFMTENGEKEGHIMTGIFVINGSASAFGFRVGSRITDNLSYFLPAGK
ncbi:glutathionylspermidine synthase [Fictibacillus aquaticus]|uniref:Glutathionylspermidine synthase n=2 Tax=Fictibacillus aquaticus TaxID=2021314 RepID=A0A235F6W2_9BACL|nr:glutathionylspermidine synthase [Fictibacillus aquaticus]